MNISGNKNNIAVVVVGYNRKKSIKRLLNSLLNSHYLNDNVPLVICLDNCGNNDVYDFANQFNWRFGEKFVNYRWLYVLLKLRLSLFFNFALGIPDYDMSN